MNNNIYIYVFPSLPNLMTPQALRAAPGPTAAAVANCGSGGAPHPCRPRRRPHTPRRRQWPIAVRALPARSGAWPKAPRRRR